MKVAQLLEDLFADSAKARKAKQRDKPVRLVRLNKDGSESSLHDAVSYYDTAAEAKAFHDQLVKNNPVKKIAHHLYSFNGDETFKGKLVAGKSVPLKGGISNEPDIDDAVDAFMEMLDSEEGSAASTWMDHDKRVELYNLYKQGWRVKGVGVDLRGRTTTTMKKKQMADRGWKYFAQGDNSDYSDMVFVKEK